MNLDEIADDIAEMEGLEDYADAAELDAISLVEFADDGPTPLATADANAAEKAKAEAAAMAAAAAAEAERQRAIAEAQRKRTVTTVVVVGIAALVLYHLSKAGDGMRRALVRRRAENSPPDSGPSKAFTHLSGEYKKRAAEKKKILRLIAKNLPDEIKRGDLVTWKERMPDEEATERYRVLEVDRERALVRLEGDFAKKLAIKPTKRVNVSDLKRVE